MRILKKTILMAGFICILTVPVSSVQGQEVKGDQFACESVSVAYNTATSLTKATWQPGGAVPPVKRAVITVETAHIRWRADGTDPTLTVGLLGTWNSNDAKTVIVLEGESQIRNFSAMGLAPTAAVLNVCYER